MTIVNIKRETGHYMMDINGHAGYADPGIDIVCSAVSILSYTFIQTLQNLEEQGKIYMFYTNIKEGNVQIEFRYSDNNVQSVIDTIENGYSLIENQYGEYVRVIGGK